MVRCPQCGNPIQPNWDWCHHCGFDPEGLKPAGWQPAATPSPPSAASPPRPPSYAPPPGYAPPQGYAPPPGYAPPGPGAPPYGAMGYPPPAYGGAPPPKNTGATTVVKVLGSIGIAFVLLVVVLVGAVTLLGKSSSSKFSSVAKAIDDDPAPTTTTEPVTWTVWHPPDNSFSIEFPGTPTMKDDNTTGPHMAGVDVTYANKTVQYFLFYGDLAPNYYFPDPYKTVHGAVDGFAAENHFTITATDNTDFAGIPAVTFTATREHETILGLVLVAGKRVYTLSTAATPQGQADWAHFRDSFHIN